jgi:hypothetical protein
MTTFVIVKSPIETKYYWLELSNTSKTSAVTADTYIDKTTDQNISAVNKRFNGLFCTSFGINSNLGATIGNTQQIYLSGSYLVFRPGTGFNNNYYQFSCKGNSENTTNPLLINSESTVISNKLISNEESTFAKTATFNNGAVFNNYLPTSNVTPSDNTQLITKIFADNNFMHKFNDVEETMNGTKTFGNRVNLYGQTALIVGNGNANSGAAEFNSTTTFNGTSTTTFNGTATFNGTTTFTGTPTFNANTIINSALFLKWSTFNSTIQQLSNNLEIYNYNNNGAFKFYTYLNSTSQQLALEIGKTTTTINTGLVCSSTLYCSGDVTCASKLSFRGIDNQFSRIQQSLNDLEVTNTKNDGNINFYTTNNANTTNPKLILQIKNNETNINSALLFKVTDTEYSSKIEQISNNLQITNNNTGPITFYTTSLVNSVITSAVALNIASTATTISNPTIVQKITIKDTCNVVKDVNFTTSYVTIDNDGGNSKNSIVNSYDSLIYFYNFSGGISPKSNLSLCIVPWSGNSGGIKITANGTVGINTKTPDSAYKLDVTGNSRFRNGITVTEQNDPNFTDRVENSSSIIQTTQNLMITNNSGGEIHLSTNSTTHLKIKLSEVTVEKPLNATWGIKSSVPSLQYSNFITSDYSTNIGYNKYATNTTGFITSSVLTEITSLLIETQGVYILNWKVDIINTATLTGDNIFKTINNLHMGLFSSNQSMSNTTLQMITSDNNKNLQYYIPGSIFKGYYNSGTDLYRIENNNYSTHSGSCVYINTNSNYNIYLLININTVDGNLFKARGSIQLVRLA